MSNIRTTPDSAVETTEPKRRAIDPKEQNSFDWNDALFKGVPPPPPPYPQSSIAYLFNHMAIEILAEEVGKTPQLVQRAKEVLAAIPIPECGDEEEEEGVQKFSNLVRGTWPLLSSAFREAMYEPRARVVHLVKSYASRDSATQRWAHMKADPALESSLAILKPHAATTEYDILRLFLSFLFGYWGDKAELSKVDEVLEFPPPHRENLVKYFSYEIKCVDDAKDMEHVRKWLGTQYGNEVEVDVDDFVERIKSSLLYSVEKGEECGHFNGSTARVEIRVINPWSFLVVIHLVEEDLWI